MADELKQLATAIVALAESNQGIGGALREQMAIQSETNRVLGLIHDQNASILEQVKLSNDRHRDSERAILKVKSVVQDHGERLAKVESAVGLSAPPEQQS